eukprot:3357578-Lingulodinium_polyedra.AAC.1
MGCSMRRACERGGLPGFGAMLARRASSARSTRPCGRRCRVWRPEMACVWHGSANCPGSPSAGCP